MSTGTIVVLAIVGVNVSALVLGLFFDRKKKRRERNV